MKKIFCLLFFFLSHILATDLNFNTYSSHFTQSVKSKNSALSYSGHFTLSQEQAYWSYDTPSKKEIYINKNQIVLVEHDLEQVVFSHLDNIPNLNEIFKKAKHLNDNQLIAKYENINYTITLKDNEIQSIAYKDEFENDILITLNHQIKNPTINPEVFKPKFPNYYDMVR
ncbi:LolA-like outer membrane lipoprotein chaperone [Campylobacter coli]|uniref:LolA-like outer membrane lipoprotein chaperone n=1 Tax=Campylobacter coli TaxID=195 RepID=UPI0038254FA7